MGLFRKSEPTGDQSKNEADVLVERMTAAMEERFNPLLEKVNALETKWSTIESEANRSAEADRVAAEKSGNENLTAEEKNEKEKRALFAMNVVTNARVTEAELIAGISAQWSHLIPKLRNVFSSTPVEKKADPNYHVYCNNVLNMMIGESAREAGLRYDQGGSRFYIEDAAGKTGGEKSPLADPALSWQDPVSGRTEAASDTLRKLGIKPEDFVKSMNEGIV